MRLKTIIEDTTVETYKPVRRRLILIRGIFFLMFTACVARLYYLQIHQFSFWKNLSTIEHQKNIIIEKHRGTIFDRNGNDLAISVETKSLYAIPPELQSRLKEVITAVSPILNISEDKLLKLLTKKTKFVWLKRNLSKEEYEKIRELNFTGLEFRNEYKRIYPKGNLAAQLIGSVGNDDKGLLDNKGLCGMEWSYNDLLKGGTEKEIKSRTLTGNQYEKIYNSSNIGGNSFILTIDEIIQHIIEQEIETAFEEWKPESAIVIVMDPLTGEILGMANRPTFDNAHIQSSTARERRNRCISDLFEPGSIFKIITFSAALENHIIKLDDIFRCNGVISFQNGKYKMRCHGVVHGNQSVMEVFANSCNVCSIQVAQKIGQKNFSEFIDRFKFRESTDIMPKVSEPRGILRDVKDWSLLSLPSISIGQEVAITGLQLIKAGCSILNSGIMMKPLLIKEIKTPSGNIESFFPKIDCRVMSPETAEKIKKMMREVVVAGSGHNANIKGYNIIGKTGTAQIGDPEGGYIDNIWTTSFLGFVNEPDYKLGILVSLKNPQKKPDQRRDVSGGMVAAPVFKRIAERILMYKQILPTNMRINTIIRISQKKSDYRVPDFVGKTFDDVSKELKNDIEYTVMGNGSLVVKQFPPAQRLMNRKDKLLIFLGNSDDLAANKMLDKETFMRHFIGKSMRESLEMLRGFDQKVLIEGSGFVTEQYPGAGSPLESDTVIRLKFSSLKR